MAKLDYYQKAFNNVGWFIPPYVTLVFLGKLAKEINVRNQSFDQKHLESFLSIIYSPKNLSVMVTERYPITPFILDYKEIISESVESHFLGLNHIAVAGLIPVIEGAGRKLAEHRSVSAKDIKQVFINLATDCKDCSKTNGIGDSDEIESMMDSFIEFTKNILYVNSSNYPLEDNTNRHGILHGAYSDEDYGQPINFYKSIAAVDFLCFVSAFDAVISWLAPEHTQGSDVLLAHYHICMKRSKYRPTPNNK